MSAAPPAPASSIKDEMKKILDNYNSLRTKFIITDTLEKISGKKIHVFKFDTYTHKIGTVYTDNYNNIFSNPEEIKEKIEYVTNFFVNHPETYRSVEVFLKKIVEKEEIKSKCSNINNANYLNIILLLSEVRNLLNRSLIFPPALKSNFLIVNFYILCYQGKQLNKKGITITSEEHENLCLLLCYIIIGDFLQECNVTLGEREALLIPDAGTTKLKGGGKRRRSRNKRRAKTRKNLRKRSRKSKKNN